MRGRSERRGRDARRRSSPPGRITSDQSSSRADAAVGARSGQATSARRPGRSRCASSRRFRPYCGWLGADRVPARPRPSSGRAPGSTTQPSGRRATTASSRRDAGDRAGDAGGEHRSGGRRARASWRPSASSSRRRRSAASSRPSSARIAGQAVAQQLQEGQRLLPVLGQIAGHQPVEAGRDRPPRCAARRGSAASSPASRTACSCVIARAAREHQAGQQQAAPDRRRSPAAAPARARGRAAARPRPARRPAAGAAAAAAGRRRARRNASRAARQARRLGSSSSVSASRSRSQRQQPGDQRRPGTGGRRRWCGRSASSREPSRRRSPPRGSAAAPPSGRCRRARRAGHLRRARAPAPGRSVSRSAGHSQGAALRPFDQQRATLPALVEPELGDLARRRAGGRGRRGRPPAPAARRSGPG